MTYRQAVPPVISQHSARNPGNQSKLGSTGLFYDLQGERQGKQQGKMQGQQQRGQGKMQAGAMQMQGRQQGNANKRSGLRNSWGYKQASDSPYPSL